MDRRRGIPVPPWSFRSQVPGDFRAIGREFLGYMIDLGGLSPRDRVLDIGCRSGRMSIPLAGYLRAGGRYEGVDDWAEGTAWCRNALTSRYPNFEFRQLDMGAVGTGSDPASLPYPDDSFDFVMFGSILHLTPAAFEYYVREAARVTRIGGVYFGTWHLLNQWKVDRSDHGVPAIACTEAVARERLRRAGLTVEAVHRGSWDGVEPSLSYQDLVVARKGEVVPDPGAAEPQADRRAVRAPSSPAVSGSR